MSAKPYSRSCGDVIMGKKKLNTCLVLLKVKHILRTGDIQSISDAVQSRWKIALYPFNWYTLEIFFLCYLLPFILRGGLKGEKKYLTLSFLAVFTYLSVSVTGCPHDEKHLQLQSQRRLCKLRHLAFGLLRSLCGPTI